ncbi:hypothetical protein VE02_05893 [Pseudogymnoascus sp. 03VT05]|nr:hypothetical protein VE02_05893 [Pseudogymnoascus sp. 03VT05]
MDSVQMDAAHLDTVHLPQGDDQCDGHSDEDDGAAEELRDILDGSYSATMSNDFLDRLYVPMGFNSDASKIHGSAIDFMRYFSTLDVAACNYNAEYQPDERPFMCARCQRTFKHKDDPTAHVKRIHDWEPKECPKCPEGGLTYTLKAELRKHHESVHAPSSRFVPQRCNFEGCTSQHIFQTERTFKKHLDGIHHLVGKELAIYIERARAPE